MKNRIIFLISVVLGIAVSACVSEQDVSLPTSSEVVFYATNGDKPSSKTVLLQDGIIQWKPGEQISIFYGNSSYLFSSTNTKAAYEVEFHGVLDGIEYTDNGEFWAVYPYKESNSFDGSSVTVTLPSEQTAVAGSFDDDLFISIAKTKDYNLQFYNVCGGVRFSVTHAGVKKVVFSGNNDEPLAGKAKVSFSNGTPYVESVENPVTSITLTPPDGGTFELGRYYYIVSFPVDLLKGYNLLLVDSEGRLLERTGNQSIAVRRSIWGVLDEADMNRVYEQPANEIWYTTTDGKTVTPRFSTGQIISNVYEGGKGIITLSSETDQIPKSAFYSNKTLATVSLPKTIRTIGESAFYDCTSLEEVSIDDGLTAIETYAFSGCTCLITVNLPNTLQTIGDRVFHSSTKLKNITIPESVTSIEEYAFFGCSSLETIVIPSGVVEIPRDVFCDCINLTSVTLPYGIQSIGAYAFSGCSKLDGIIIPETVNSLGEGVFSRCNGLTRIVIPEGITTIVYSLFASCYNLQEVVLHDGITEINPYAFYNCYKLGDIRIPKNVQFVGEKAFSGCTSLTEVTFPSSILYIGNNVLASDTKLEKIVVGKKTPPTIYTYTFDSTNNCPIYVPFSSIASYKAAENWSKYSSRIVGIPEVHEAVDLGLSVMWSTTNLGADSPEETGEFFAWGETESKDSFTFENYKWGNKNPSNRLFTKYCNNEKDGEVDNLTRLSLVDDAANVRLGSYWRMPTYSEMYELLTRCQFEKLTVNGVNGYKVVGPSGNHVFIPCTGVILPGNSITSTSLLCFWTSNTVAYLYSDDSLGNCDAVGFQYKDTNSMNTCIGWYNREWGMTVRPVYKETVYVSDISMPSIISLNVGDRHTQTVTVSPSDATDKDLFWFSDNPSVVSIENGEWVAKAKGTAKITATSADGACSASCTVMVINPASYLVYRANPSLDSSGDNYRHYESHLSGFSAKVVEMKFQLAYSSDTYCTLASDNTLKDWSQELKFSTSQLIWNQDDPTDYRCSLSLSEAGVSRTSIITLKFDGTKKTLSINGHSFGVPYDIFDFGCFLAEYSHESDEGDWTWYDGIPDNSKIYYIKGWDETGKLVYLGYPTQSVNPSSSNVEYCWYTYWANSYSSNKITYQFANDAVNQGGYNGYTP